MRTRLRGEPPAVYEQIGPTVEDMARSVTPDETRPTIEFYRRRDEIDLLLPIPTTHLLPPRRVSNVRPGD